MTKWNKGYPSSDGNYLTTDGRRIRISAYKDGEGFGNTVQFKGGSYFAEDKSVVGWMELPNPSVQE